MSLINFWFSVFRLPSTCIDKLESICSAFLWSGPCLNSKKAKVSWEKVCLPKLEGGLGLRRLKEANKASCLKLIWRVISVRNSLWVDWIHIYLIKQNSFWDIKEKQNQGSWIWRKLLKYRSYARDFHQVKVESGTSVHYWFDHWNKMGCLWNLVGSRGVIDMGISRDVKISDIPSQRRRRNHRVEILNQMESELEVVLAKRERNVEDKHVWRNKAGIYKPRYSTKDTWSQIRQSSAEVPWYQSIWFTHATPKFSFLAWLAIKNRLHTGEVMRRWKINIKLSCSFCDEALETREHLFFGCKYTSEVWKKLVGGLLHRNYTEDWLSLVQLLSRKDGSYVRNFLLRYSFQTTIHTIWRERNRRRHGDGERSTTKETLISMVDCTVRNRIQTIRNQDRKMEDAYTYWLESRGDVRVPN